MRLEQSEIRNILDAIRKQDATASIYLYGSRTDDSLRGGIDLLVLSEKISLSQKFDILIAIKSKIGEQKIDLLIKKKADISSDSFVQSILSTAVALK